jgi:hypothetical protein
VDYSDAKSRVLRTEEAQEGIIYLFYFSVPVEPW